jgi:hypothetical protein
MGGYRDSLPPTKRAALDRWIEEQLADAPLDWTPEQMAQLDPIRRRLRAEAASLPARRAS